MRLYLKSLVAVFALIVATGPITKAVDFYATRSNNDIYGVNIDGTMTRIGSSGPSGFFLYDIATDPVTQDVYLLGTQPANPFAPLSGQLYSATIGTNSVSKTLIGQITAETFIEGGLTFNSFQGSNQLYASGAIGATAQTRTPTLYNVNPSTGVGTIINNTFTALRNDMDSIFTAPDGRLWALVDLVDVSRVELFRFATDGTVDKNIILTGFEAPSAGGVTVKAGVTYYLTTPDTHAYSNFGTLQWDSVNNTYTGGFNLITNSLVGGMTGLALAPTTVPEPSTYALAAIASGVMAVLARRRKSKLVKSLSI